VGPTEPTSQTVQFDEYSFDPRTRELLRNGHKLRLAPQPARVLAILIDRAGELVTREEIAQQVWGSETYVDFERGLNFAIRQIRERLGDSAERPRYIETVPKAGYRFIAPVQAVNTGPGLTLKESSTLKEEKIAEAEVAATARTSSKTSSRRRRPWLAAVLAPAIVAAAYWLRPLSPPLRVTSVVQLSKTGTAWRNESLIEDSARLYYTERTGSSSFQLRQILLNGNEDTPVAGLPPDSLVRGLSADHTTFLVMPYPVAGDPPRPFWSVPVVGGPPRRLGNFLAQDVVWSPDGRSLAYTQGNQLFLANADGTGERLLANLPGFYMRWSPDGRRIRFTVEDDENGQLTIWEVGTNDRHLRQLKFNWPGAPMEGFGEWTPDGRYYVFVSRRNGISNLWAIEERSDWMHRPLHEPVQLTAGPMDYYRPLPSSDGMRLFAVATRHAGQLLRYDMVRKKFAPFMGGASDDHVSFTQDGHWVAYVSYPEGTLWRARPDGSQALQLTFPPLRALDLSWSPDGRSIAFTTQQPGERQKIELISRDGGNSMPLIDEPYSQFAPSWSADGNFLVYTRCSQVDTHVDCALYRFDLAAKIAHMIPGSGGLYGGALATDGRHLAAVEAATRRIFLVDLQSGQRTQLTRSHPRAEFPTWSRDSQYVYFNDLMSGEPAIFRVRVSDAREEKVTDVIFPTAGTFGFWSGLAPDGSPLLLHDQEQSDVYVLTLARP